MIRSRRERQDRLERNMTEKYHGASGRSLVRFLALRDPTAWFGLAKQLMNPVPPIGPKAHTLALKSNRDT
jgi:hypothetical protein